MRECGFRRGVPRNAPPMLHDFGMTYAAFGSQQALWTKHLEPGTPVGLQRIVVALNVHGAAAVPEIPGQLTLELEAGSADRIWPLLDDQQRNEVHDRNREVVSRMTLPDPDGIFALADHPNPKTHDTWLQFLDERDVHQNLVFLARAIPDAVARLAQQPRLSEQFRKFQPTVE